MGQGRAFSGPSGGTDDERRRILTEALFLGACVTQVCRRYDIDDFDSKILPALYLGEHRRIFRRLQSLIEAK